MQWFAGLSSATILRSCDIRSYNRSSVVSTLYYYKCKVKFTTNIDVCVNSFSGTSSILFAQYTLTAFDLEVTAHRQTVLAIAALAFSVGG